MANGLLTSTIRSKGRTLIPLVIRKQLGIRGGTEFEWSSISEQMIMARVVKKSPEDQRRVAKVATK